MSTENINKNPIYIHRNNERSGEHVEILQDEWIEQYHSDKILIECEEKGALLTNEENNTLMCMEYKE